MLIFKFIYLLLLLRHRDESDSTFVVKLYFFAMSLMLLLPLLNILQGLSYYLLTGHWHQELAFERSFSHSFGFYWPKLVFFLPVFYLICGSPRAKLDQALFNTIHADNVLAHLNKITGYFLVLFLPVVMGGLWFQADHPLIAALVSIAGTLLMSYLFQKKLRAYAA